MTILILLAAGFSKRFGSSRHPIQAGTDKILAKIAGQPMILYSTKIFASTSDKILIVANKNNFQKIKLLAPAAQIILGGKTRQESVGHAIKFLKKTRSNSTWRCPAPDDLIIIHNAANPFVAPAEIKKCLSLAKKHGACIVGHRPTDTAKIIKGDFIECTIPRENILLAQTPQIFKWKILQNSYNNTKKQTFTDDASMVEAAGHKVAWTQASYTNKKVTFTADVPVSPKALIGIGADFHKFSNSGVLTLAGLKFPKYKKLKADSDGDAILHAIATAISSALGGGSLGTLATPMCKRGIKNSKKYLAYALARMKRAGYKISNAGIHIETQKIKIDPIAPAIRKNLSRLLNIAQNKIGITANSGNTPGIKCIASVLCADRLR